jgi:hypothetical protein
MSDFVALFVVFVVVVVVVASVVVPADRCADGDECR